MVGNLAPQQSLAKIDGNLKKLSYFDYILNDLRDSLSEGLGLVSE